MKVVVAGTRGIPNIMGGVETHCEELYPRLVKLGCDVTIVRRSCYITENNHIQNYKGVKLKDIHAPRKKSIEAIVHTLRSVLYAKREKADILHIHAIGPSIMIPFARLLGLKVVMTHHGADYERQKWGKIAKWVLKYGEKMGVKYAHTVIVISDSINQSIIKKYNRKDACLIFNGVNMPIPAKQTGFIESLELEKEQYIFAMGRFVEEKGFHLLIDAFSKNNIDNFKLVIAGDADHETNYSQQLKEQARSANVILTGFVKGEKLNELLSNARLFVLPSYHEGLPIALLEAMSYGLDILTSDIPANKAVELPEDSYFSCGNVDDLSNKLLQKLSEVKTIRNYDLSKYNWDDIANQTMEVYKNLTTKRH